MSSSEAASATKAIVHEFTCLFTHDLKRKQKRWQDGQLKYHTFNGKVMVYDDRGNYVGESRWQEEEELADGDEFPLDRGGAIVQVSECTGSHEQNLADLVDKRAKEVQQRRVEKAARQSGRTGFSTPQSSLTGPPRAIVGHRPLNTLIASPARMGRAVVPTKSPYEVRNVAKPGETEGGTPPSGTSKRKRDVSPPSKQGHARALFGTQLSFANPSTIAQARRQVLSQRPTNIGSSGQTSQSEFTKASQESTVEVTLSESSRAKHPERDKLSNEAFLRATPQPEPPVKVPKEHSPKAQRRNLPKHDAIESSSTAKSVETIAPEVHKNHHSIPIDENSDDDSRDGQVVDKRKEHKRRRGQELELERQQHLREAKRQRQREHRVEPAKKVANVEVIDLDDENEPEPTPRTSSKPALTRLESLPPVEDETTSLSKPKPAKRKALLSVVGRRTPNAASSRADKDINNAPSRPTDIDSATVSLPPEPNGPRTELRIGSRRKRGLLMMSERKLVGAPRPKASASDTRVGHTRCPSLFDDDTPARRPESPQAQPKSQDEGDDVACDPEIQSPKRRRPRQERQGTEKLADEAPIFVESSPPSSDDNIEPERHLLPRQSSRPDEEDIENAKKPRIARLARKSVRSREIFGYVPEDAAPTIAFSAAAPQSKVFEETSADLDAGADVAQVADEIVPPPSPHEELLVDDDVPSDPDEMLGDALHTKPKELSGEAGAMLNSQGANAAFEEWLAQMSSPPDADEVNKKVEDEEESLGNAPKRGPEEPTAESTHGMPEKATSEAAKPDTERDNETCNTNVDDPICAEQYQDLAPSTMSERAVSVTAMNAEDRQTMLQEATAPFPEKTTHVPVKENVTTGTTADSDARDNKVAKSTDRSTTPTCQIDRLAKATNGTVASVASDDKLHTARNAAPQSIKAATPHPAREVIAGRARHDATQATYDGIGPESQNGDWLGQPDGSSEGPGSERPSAVPALSAMNTLNTSDKHIPKKTTSSTHEIVKTLHSRASKATMSAETTTATESLVEQGGLSEALPVNDGQAIEEAPAAPEPPPDHSNGGKPRILVNPATRGKKAASKAHAAGIAPRSLIQLDPPSIAPVARRRAPVMPLPRKTSNAGILPAFEKASGGAWSAHAGDLLGISRPGKK